MLFPERYNGLLFLPQLCTEKYYKALGTNNLVFLSIPLRASVTVCNGINLPVKKVQHLFKGK